MATKLKTRELWIDRGEVWRALAVLIFVVLVVTATAIILSSPNNPKETRAWWALAPLAVVVLLAVLSWWHGALLLVAAAVIGGATAWWFVDLDWLDDPAHLRTAALGAIVVLGLALVAVSAEFARATLRIAAVAALVGGVLLTAKVGRSHARGELLTAARATSSDLDATLAGLAATAASVPAGREGEAARQERALLAAALALPESSQVRAVVVAAVQGPARRSLDVVALEALVTTAEDVAVVEIAERYVVAGRVAGESAFDLAVEAQAAVVALCHAADGATTPLDSRSEPAAPVMPRPEESDVCRPGTGAEDGDRHRASEVARLPVLVATAEWRLVLLRDAVQDVPAEDLAAAEREVAVTTASAQPAGGPVDLLSEGAGALVGGLPWMDDDGVPAAVTAVGWVLLAAAAAFGYRQLEIRSGATEVGPVTLQPVGKDVPPDDAKLLGELRHHILRNIPEPGAVPGAQSLQPVTDLLEATGDERGKVVGALLRLGTATLFPPTGYCVETVLSRLPPDADDETVVVATADRDTPREGAPSTLLVTLLVKDVRTGATKKLVTARGTDEHKTIRLAGYQAAAWVLGRSARAPSWAVWEDGTSEALCRFVEATEVGGASLRDLRDAVADAPRSGVLLGMLGAGYDLDDQHGAALSYYLRALALHHRYPVARYRAAISLSLLAADDAKAWSAASEAERTELLDDLRAAADLLQVRWSSDTAEVLEGADRLTGRRAVEPLCRAGNELLAANDRALRVWRLAHHAFRRSERRTWLELLPVVGGSVGRPPMRVKVLRAISQSARLALLQRAIQSIGNDRKCSRDRLESEKAHVCGSLDRAAHLTWQVDYNLACADAIAAGAGPGTPDPERAKTALGLLRLVPSRPYSNQLTRQWAETDPDLAALRRNPYAGRFGQVISGLRSLQDIDQRAVRRIAQQARGRLDELCQRDRRFAGAEALFLGDPLAGLDLHDLRVVGEVAEEKWRVWLSGQPCVEISAAVTTVVEREWVLAVDALLAPVEHRPLGPAVGTSSGATEAVWHLEGAGARLVATNGNGHSGPGVDGTLVVPGYDGPALTVASRGAPLVAFVADDVRVDHAVAEGVVRFVVTQRLAVARRGGVRVTQGQRRLAPAWR